MRRLIAHFCVVLEWVGSEWAKSVARLRFGRKIRFGARVRLHRGVRIEIFDGGSIVIGDRVSIYRGAIIAARGGKLSIGSDSLVSYGSIIVSHRAIDIGDGVLIAEYGTIRDHDHGHTDPGLPIWRQACVASPISIGANVWLAAKVTVTRGTAIPSDTIVGANSVVTKPLDRPGIYAGAPVRLVGTLGTQAAA